jgi:hypothetical protein
MSEATKKYEIVPFATTGISSLFGDDAPQEGAYIARIYRGTGPTESFEFGAIHPARDVEDVIRRFAVDRARDIAALTTVVYWQHQLIEYNSTYQAFLLDQMTEEEFEEEAEKFVQGTLEFSGGEICEHIGRTNRLLALDFTPSDFASMLRADYGEVVEAIENCRSADTEGLRIKDDK